MMMMIGKVSIVISQTNEFRDEWFFFSWRDDIKPLTAGVLWVFSTIRASLWKISGCRQRLFHLCFSYQVSGFTSVGLSTRKQLYCCCCFAVDVRDQAGKPCLADFWRPSKTRIRFTLSPSHHRKVSLVFFWFVAFVWRPFISLVHEETSFWAPRPK